MVITCMNIEQEDKVCKKESERTFILFPVRLDMTYMYQKKGIELPINFLLSSSFHANSEFCVVGGIYT